MILKNVTEFIDSAMDSRFILNFQFELDCDFENRFAESSENLYYIYFFSLFEFGVNCFLILYSYSNYYQNFLKIF